MSLHQRCLIAKLRLVILPIHTEVGLFKVTTLDNRICQVCDMQEVEDQIHLACKCNLHKDH